MQMNRPKLTYVGPTLRRREGLFFEPRVGGHCAPFPSADATAVRGRASPLDAMVSAHCLHPTLWRSRILACVRV